MRQVLVFSATTSALVVMSAVAIALMISIAGERTSWVLVAVFALDSAVLVMLAARAILARRNGHAGNGSAMPH